jgi:hypothetical protein
MIRFSKDHAVAVSHHDATPLISGKLVHHLWDATDAAFDCKGECTTWNFHPDVVYRCKNAYAPT